MKKTMKKILAFALTVIMLLSVAAPVFANTAAEGCPEVHSKANLDAKGIKYTEISKHAAEFCSDSAYTVYQCQGCNKYFADDIVTSDKECDLELIQEATCAAEGIQKCKVCNYEHKTPKTTDHDYEAEIPCGNPGEKTNLVCKICGDKQEDVVVADNHIWEITVTVEPECNVPGKATYKCVNENCGFVKEVAITANSDHANHKWVYGEAQKGQCFVDGTTKATITAGYYCEDCGVSAKKGQIIVVDGEEVENTTVYNVTETEHTFDFNNPTYEEKVTCTTAGLKFFGCINCGYVENTIVTPARGHEWEREGAAELDFDTLPCTPGKCSDDGVGEDVYVAYCSDCMTNVDIPVAHTITKNKVVAPTCRTEGYTCDYCEDCGFEFNKRNKVDPVADNHVYFATKKEAEDAGYPDLYYVITKANCTTAGTAFSTCKYCFEATTNTLPLAPIYHSYYVVENGAIVKNEDGTPKLQGGVLDCLNGVMVYTCTKCTDDDKLADRVLKVAIAGFDFNNLECHQGWVNGAWYDNYVEAVAGDCDTDRVVYYTCPGHAKPITVNMGRVHNIDPDTYTPETAPKCGTKGHVGYEACKDCKYEKGTFGVDGEIEALGHLYDEKTYAAPIDATCIADGYSGYGICVRENCDHSKDWTFGHEKEEDRVIPKLGHNHVLVEDINKDANNGLAWVVTCTKYAYEHYICDRCTDEGFEIWTNYVAATGHKYEITLDPTCATFGWEECVNKDCGIGYKHGQLVAKLPHTDVDGNVIECVTEDFYCFACCEPQYGADKKFNGEYAKDKINWKESHYEVVTTIPPHVCTEYHYVLHVCDKCKTEWTVGEFGLNEHDTENVKYNVLEAPIDFLKPGKREVICGNANCTYVIRTEEFGLGVEFSFTFDNALVPGASIVNSSYLAVRVSTNSYKQMLSSVNFQFYADEDIFTLVEVKVEDTASPFYGMFFAGQTDDVVNVYGTVQNDANGNYADVEWDGADKYLVTLIFKVADTANGEITGFVSADSAVVVNTVNGDEVNSAVAGYDYGYITVLGPVDDNDTPDDDTDDKYFELTINTLGDVNGDADRTNGLVASAIDVNKVRELIATGEYLAEADIDKDGAITVFDFEYLAEYLVGNYDYAQLCFFPDIIPEAPVVTPGCPCCP